MLVVWNDTLMIRAWWRSFYQKAFSKYHVVMEDMADVLGNDRDHDHYI